MEKDNHPNHHLLVVDDEVPLLEFYKSILEDDYTITCAKTFKEALVVIAKKPIDLIISDISIPADMNGLEFVRDIRRRGIMIPVILVTGHPTLDTAIKAVEFGALRYLTKPFEVNTLRQAVEQGLRLQRIGSIRTEIAKVMPDKNAPGIQLEEQKRKFEFALDTLWLAFQPIVCWSRQSLIGYEVLIRNDEPELTSPPVLFDLAEKLGRSRELSHHIRIRAAKAVAALPKESSLFLNISVHDLDDPNLYETESTLSRNASRVVLELSEQLDLTTAAAIGEKLAQLRGMGFRVAMDDLGAGHSGLAAFAKIEPDIVKLDIQLVRGAEKEPTKLRLIESLMQVCRELNILCIGEGVEKAETVHALIAKGCDYFQGYYFGRPERIPKPFAASLFADASPQAPPK